MSEKSIRRRWIILALAGLLVITATAGATAPAPTQPAIHCYTIHEFTDEAAPVLVRARADALTVSVEYRGTFRSAVLLMAVVDPRGVNEATTGGCFWHTKRMWPWMATVRPSSRR